MRTDHFRLLCDIGELGQLFTDTQNIEEFLQKKVFLELLAKVKKDWRDQPGMLRSLGYNG